MPSRSPEYREPDTMQAKASDATMTKIIDRIKALEARVSKLELKQEQSNIKLADKKG